MMINRPLRDMIFPEFSGGSYSPSGSGGLGEPGYQGRTADESSPPGWTPNPAAWGPYSRTPGGDPFYSALNTAARQTQEPWIQTRSRDVPSIFTRDTLTREIFGPDIATDSSPPYLIASDGPIFPENSDKASGSEGRLYWTVDDRFFIISDTGVVSPFGLEEEVTVTAPREPPSSPPGPPLSLPVPPTVPDSGYSIEPPPPIRGGTSDALYFRPGWAQISENGRQEARKANPDLHKVYSGLIASPVAVLEEYLVRPVLNVPHTAINKVITAGQHFDRGSLWVQQDEWAEAAAEGLEGVADLALAFLDVTALLDSFGSHSAPPGGRRPAPRASLAEEIPAGVPQEYASDLSGVTGKGAVARNRAIDSAIEQHLPDLELTYHPQYNPGIRTGLALKGEGVQIGKNRFSSLVDLIDAIIHEELHHRWYDRSLPEPHHPRIAAQIPDWDFFHYTVGRYLRFRGWRTLDQVPKNSERRALERAARGEL